MLNLNLKLSQKIFDRDVERIPTRQGYGEGLVKAGEADKNVVVLCADLTESTRSILFKEKFPDRFIEMGVAEQGMATVAAGIANYGKIPFISSYAAFSPGRNWEQIRTTIALNDVPVKIVGAHAGLTVGPDGATHQMLEDIALMRVMPNMVVIYPCDSVEAEKATILAAKNGKPTYIRLAREKTPVMTTAETNFDIGKAQVFWTSKNPVATIIASGPLLYEALVAAKELEEIAIQVEVINMATIKPIDERAIISSVKKTGALVSVEEHQINGGLGGAISEVLSKNFPVAMEFVGMPDSFGESGEPEELLTRYHMKSQDIVAAVKKVIKRRTA